MDSLDSKWQILFFSFIFWGLLIFLVYRLLNYILTHYLYRRKYFQEIHHYMPIAEIISWLLFFGLSLNKFFEARSMFALVIIGILAFLFYWFSKFWLKDLIAGIIFKSTKRMKKGDLFQVGEWKGIIKKFQKTNIILETKEGNTLILTYSSIIEKASFKSEESEKSSGFNFELQINQKSNINEHAQQIKKFIVALPWVSNHKPPIISPIKETSEHCFFEITIFPIDKSYNTKIQRHVKDEFI